MPGPRVVGRLAPSPTGLVHVGNARSLLWAWLSARSQGGAVWLRIEDLIPGPAEAVAALLREVAWLGLDWDAPPDLEGVVPASEFAPELTARPPLVLQSARAEAYRRALSALTAAGRCYPCVCTRADIEAALRAPHADDKGARYPGTCRGRFRTLDEALRYEAAQSGRAGRTPLGAALRMRAPAAAVAFADALHGACVVDVRNDSGDFVVRRKDGAAAYMLAVVVDDRAMGVTEVVRGDDLLDATAQQLIVHDALAAQTPGERAAPPRWVHVPLVIGDDGRRLAKRNRSLHLQQLRADGVAPHQLRAWLAASMGLPGIGDRDQLLAAFANAAGAGTLARAAVVFGDAEHAALLAGQVPPPRWVHDD